MDEALVTAAVDLSGRAIFRLASRVPDERPGSFRRSSARSFGGLSFYGGAFNLHVVGHGGRNTHHILEAVFKATARALRQAVERSAFAGRAVHEGVRRFVPDGLPR